MKNKTFSRLLLIAPLLLIGAGCQSTTAEITTFDECVKAGNPVMESYPRQCRAGGKTFVEVVTAPPGGVVTTIVQLGEMFTLKVGESRGVQGGLRVTLVEVNDSRCPKDVQCIWAGELAPKLRIEGPEETAPGQELTLGTTRTKTGDVSGFHFVLNDATETTATLVITR